MRTKTLIHGFKNSQKIRVLINGFGIYMTVGDIAEKIATRDHRVAIWETAEKLARDRSGAKRRGAGALEMPTGIVHRVKVYETIDQSREFDVQLDLI